MDYSYFTSEELIQNIKKQIGTFFIRNKNEYLFEILFILKQMFQQICFCVAIRNSISKLRNMFHGCATNGHENRRGRNKEIVDKHIHIIRHCCGKHNVLSLCGK